MEAFDDLSDVEDVEEHSLADNNSDEDDEDEELEAVDSPHLHRGHHTSPWPRRVAPPISASPRKTKMGGAKDEVAWASFGAEEAAIAEELDGFKL